MTEMDVAAEDIDTLFAEGEIDLADARDLPCHTGIRLLGGNSHALGRVNAAKRVQLVRGDREVFGLREGQPNNASPWTFCSTNPSASCHWAARQAPASRPWRCARAWRPCWNVAPSARWSCSGRCTRWADRISGICPAARARRWGRGPRPSSTPSKAWPARGPRRGAVRGMLEVLPLTHIRGRSLHDSFVIVDEAQSLERNVLLTVLSRLGAGSRVVLTHDVAQRDNLRVGRHDGVAAVIEAQRAPAVRPHHAAAQRAVTDRRAGHRDARGNQPRRPA